MTGMVWIGLMAGGWWGVRGAIARREERRIDARFRRGPDGIIVGAEPIRLEGARRGAVLLLHGYNDSPQSIASVADALHARGWTVWVPLLPSHGRTLQEFARSTAEDWLNEARTKFAELQASHPQVAVGGLSMGGAIAFVLAAENPAAWVTLS